MIIAYGSQASFGIMACSIALKPRRTAGRRIRRDGSSLRTELPLFAFLALLWGSSYLFIKVAVVEIPRSRLSRLGS